MCSERGCPLPFFVCSLNETSGRTCRDSPTNFSLSIAVQLQPAELFELESAVQASVRVFDQQEQQRKEASKRRANNSYQNCPQRHGPLKHVCRVASQTDLCGNNWPSRWLRRRIAGRRLIDGSSVKIGRGTCPRSGWRRDRGNVSRSWLLVPGGQRRRTVSTEV